MSRLAEIGCGILFAVLLLVMGWGIFTLVMSL
jgi:hypothetical protein